MWAVFLEKSNGGGNHAHSNHQLTNTEQSRAMARTALVAVALFGLLGVLIGFAQGELPWRANDARIGGRPEPSFSPPDPSAPVVRAPCPLVFGSSRSQIVVHE